MSQNRTASIRAISGDRAEQMRYYRWLGNEEVTLSEVVESLGVDCQKPVTGRHVLAISDIVNPDKNETNGELHYLNGKGLACLKHNWNDYMP